MTTYLLFLKFMQSYQTCQSLILSHQNNKNPLGINNNAYKNMLIIILIIMHAHNLWCNLIIIVTYTQPDDHYLRRCIPSYNWQYIQCQILYANTSTPTQRQQETTGERREGCQENYHKEPEMPQFYSVATKDGTG